MAGKPNIRIFSIDFAKQTAEEFSWTFGGIGQRPARGGVVHSGDTR